MSTETVNDALAAAKAEYWQRCAEIDEARRLELNQTIRAEYLDFMATVTLAETVTPEFGELLDELTVAEERRSLKAFHAAIERYKAADTGAQASRIVASVNSGQPTSLAGEDESDRHEAVAVVSSLDSPVEQTADNWPVRQESGANVEPEFHRAHAERENVR